MSRFLPVEKRGGTPAEFYRFGRGVTLLATWTSGSVRQEMLGADWVPVPITHDVLEQSDERSGGALRVFLPANHAVTDTVVDLFRGTVPTATIDLALYRKSQGWPAPARVFAGDVSAAEFSGSQCILTVEPRQNALKQRALRMLYQGPCNNTLYDSFCGVVKASFSAAATVTAIATDNVTLTVPQAASQTDGYYTGGELTFGSRFGWITSHVGQTLVLLRPVPGLAVASAVTISAGCDRAIDTCDTKFSNIANHMGFPYIPTQDPFTVGVSATDP